VTNRGSFDKWERKNEEEGRLRGRQFQKKKRFRAEELWEKKGRYLKMRDAPRGEYLLIGAQNVAGGDGNKVSPTGVLR